MTRGMKRDSYHKIRGIYQYQHPLALDESLLALKQSDALLGSHRAPSWLEIAMIGGL